MTLNQRGKMKKLILFIMLVVVGAPPALAASPKKQVCPEPVSLSCLKNNFSAFYQKDYEGFFSAFRKFENKAATCKDIKSTADFLSLVTAIDVNAEVSEAYAETTEKILIKNPACFLDAATRLEDRSLKVLIMNYIKTPTFEDETKIKKTMQKYKNDAKYVKVMGLYFGK